MCDVYQARLKGLSAPSTEQLIQSKLGKHTFRDSGQINREVVFGFEDSKNNF